MALKKKNIIQMISDVLDTKVLVSLADASLRDIHDERQSTQKIIINNYNAFVGSLSCN